MPDKYQLPCSCGKLVLVEPIQAGETVRCECGNELEVPTMRLIRLLPRAPRTEPARAARRSWPLMYGLLFAAGLTTTVAGLAVAGYYQWGRSRLHTEETRWDDITAAERMIDKMPVDVAWEEWIQVRDFGLGVQQPPEFMIHRHVSRIWRKFVLGGLGVAGLGLLLIGLAIVLPRPRRRGHRRRAAADKRATRP